MIIHKPPVYKSTKIGLMTFKLVSLRVSNMLKIKPSGSKLLSLIIRIVNVLERCIEMIELESMVLSNIKMIFLIISWSA